MKRIAYLASLLCLIASAPPTPAAAGDDSRQAKIDSNRTPVDWDRPKVNVLSERIRTEAGGTRAGFYGQTIRYDTGAVTAVPSVGSVTYGNRFDTRSGVAINTYTCSVGTVQFYMAGVGGSNAFVSLYGPLAGTTAPPITSILFDATTGFNTVTLFQAISGSSFLLGVWADGSPISDLVGLDSAGTQNGQGFHGMIINDIVGTGFQTLPGVNTIVRPVVYSFPVELLSFTVDEP